MKKNYLMSLLCLVTILTLLVTCQELEKSIMVSTGEITMVQTNSAEASGTIIDMGEGITQHGHYYSKSSDPAKDILKTNLGNPEGTGGFISQITGLEAGTKYYVVAYATGSKGISYGEIKSFTTLPASVPTLTTSDVSSITYTSASTGGTISTDGGSPVTARGVCWGTTINPTIEGSKTTDGSGTGNFSSNITGLIPGTAYFTRAYATSSAGTAYGDEKTFTTTAASLPVLMSVAVIEITQTTAISGGDITNDGGMPVTARGVCWNTTGNPTIADNKTLDGSGAGLFASNITGLTQGIKYYIRAYATNIIGTAYGNELDFTTYTSSVPGAPGAPTGVAAIKGDAQATITFTAPANDGGSVITGYTVTSSPGGFTVTEPASPITVTGLVNGVAYTFTVTATNATGTGPASSASNPVTPSTLPGAPTIGTATKGNAQAIITFTAPANDGGSIITGYTVTSNPGAKTGTGTASPITVTSLTNGTAYTFTVTATNANGAGPASSASNSITPSTVPEAPIIGTATKGNAQATVTFTAPANNGGSAITGYTVTSNPDNKTATGTASPLTVISLTNGVAYTFTVTASNANGAGPASSASNSVTPSTIPGAPTIGTATAGDTQASVTFTAPASNGGAVITGYTVTSNPGGKTGTGTASPITVTGLTNLTAYTFTVVATNINGNSSPSAASNVAIPGTVTNPTTGKIWMDRNLGASRVSTSSTDVVSYGDLYQWGRLADGHQLRNSTVTTTLSSSNTPGHGNFILVSASPTDWRNPQNTDLWQGVTGISNPCPTGYRLPTEAEWEAERVTWSTNNAAGAFASLLKLPSGGDRLNSDGSLRNVGTYGYYWSSGVVTTYSYILYFSGSSAGLGAAYRSAGSSVRCIKD